MSLEPNTFGRWQRLVLLTVVAVAYVLAARLGLMLAYPGSTASPVWLPSGISLAALIILGWRALPFALAGAFTANLWFLLGSHLLDGFPALIVSFTTAIGNGAESAIAYWLVRSWSRERLLNTMSGVIRLTLAAALSCSVAAAVGSGSLVLAQKLTSEVWPTVLATWWVGDFAGIMIVGVVILSLARRPGEPWLNERSPRQLLLLGGLVVVVVLMGAVCFFFDHVPAVVQRLGLFGFFVIIAWVASRENQRWTSQTVVLISALAVAGTIRGTGPFIGVSMNQSLLDLEVFIILISLTGLLLSADVWHDRQNRFLRQERRFAKLHWFTFLLAIGLSLVGWQLMVTDALRQIEERFNASVEEAKGDLRDRVDGNVQILRGAQGLLAASQEVTLEEWIRYYQSLDVASRFPGLGPVVYVKRSSEAELGPFLEHYAAINGFPLVVRPAGSRPDYAPVVLAGNVEGENRAVLGFDMWQDPVRVAAMNRSGDNGVPVIGNRLILARGTSAESPGVLIVAPVYRHPGPPSTVAERRAGLEGFVMTSFRIGPLLKNLLAPRSDTMFVTIWDGASPVDDQLLGTTRPSGLAEKPYLSVTEGFTIRDHTWSIRFESTPGFEKSFDFSKANTVLLAGVAISLLLFTAMRALSATSDAELRAMNNSLETRIAERTAELQTAYNLVRDREYFLRNLTNHFPFVVSYCDRDLRLTFANNAYEYWFGRHPQDILGQTPIEVIGEEMAARNRPLMEAALAGQVQEFERVVRTPSGETIYALVSYVPHEVDGEVQGVFIISTDISKIKVADMEVRRLNEILEIQVKSQQEQIGSQEAMINSALDSSFTCFAVINAQGHYVRVNQALCDFVGYSSDALMGNTIFDFTFPEDEALSRSALENLVSGRQNAVQMEKRFLRADGEVVWGLDSLTRVQTTSGQDSLIIKQITDITDEKRLRAELENLVAELQTRAKELEQRNEELDRFAYGAGHDLRSPLLGIAALTSFIEEDLQPIKVPEAVTENLALIKKRMTQLDRLLSDLLTYAKAVRSEEVWQNVDLPSLIDDTWDLNIDAPGFVLVKDGPDTPIRTPRVALEQVVRNLLVNAVKHHDRPQGQIAVRWTLSPGTLHVVVEDDGPGIKKEYQKQIFELFKTLKPKDQMGGSGMGLSLVQKVVERYGYTVAVASDGQRGSQFSFDWPVEGGE